MYHKEWIDFNKNGRKDIYEDPKAPLNDRIEDLLSQMTMEEKTCQMVTLYGYQIHCLLPSGKASYGKTVSELSMST